MKYVVPGASALLLAASAVALTVGASAPALAQKADTLDPITVLATKTEEKAIDSLAAVSTIRTEKLQQIQPTRMSDLLFDMPGVWFQERADAPESAINIRGLQDFGRVAVVIDGVRQNFQRSGHNANGTFFIEPELLSGVDVIRGPVANIYGSGAIGGVASFQTKDIEDILKPNERWGFQAHTMAGTNLGQLLGSVFAGIRATPNVDLFAGVTRRTVKNYTDANGVEVPNTGYDAASAIGKVTIRPFDGHEIKFTGITYNTWYNTGQNAPPNGESVYDTKVRNDILNARWKYNKPGDNIFDFVGSIYWTKTQQDQTKILGSSNPITGTIGDHRSFSIETIGFDVHNTTRFETGPVRNAVTYGVDSFRDSVVNIDPTGNGAVTTPNGERTVSGGFVQWKANYTTLLELITAVRYDSYRLDGGGTTANGDHISPKATLGITPLAGITFYGTYAEGYRAPAVTETLVAGAHPPFAPGFPNLFTFVPNPNLRPEIGQTKEIGVNLKFDNIVKQGDLFRGKINVYRNDVSDYIELVTFGPPVIFSFCPAPFPGCPPVPVVNIPINTYSLAQYQNLSNARIEGVEVEANYDAGDWFASLAAQHIRGTDTGTGQPLLTIPPDKIAATLGVRVLDRKVTAMVKWIGVAAKNAGDIPDRDQNGVPDVNPTAAYGLVNIYLGYQPNPDVLASVTVDNLFNQYYVPYLSSASSTVFPGPGTTIKGSLTVRFGAT